MHPTAARHAMHPTVSLYRQVIWHAKRFPSKNRAKIYKEIRDEFRRNRDSTGAELETQLQVARDSLKQLMMYTGLRMDQDDWVVNLHENPMPKPAHMMPKQPDATGAGVSDTKPKEPPK